MPAQGQVGKAAILGVWGMLVVSSVDNLVYPVLVGQRMRGSSLDDVEKWAARPLHASAAANDASLARRFKGCPPARVRGMGKSAAWLLDALERDSTRELPPLRKDILFPTS